MTFDLPQIYNFNIHADCPTSSITEATARNHKIRIDEPEVVGGTDTAATPLETVLSGFLACHNVLANLIAKEMGIALTKISMELDASFNTDGVATKTATDVPFPEIRLHLKVMTNASAEEVEALKEEVSKRCPMTVIFRSAGTSIQSTWQVSNTDVS